MGQGRLGELESAFKASFEARPYLASHQRALAVLYAETRRLNEARAHFERLAGKNFADIPRSGSWNVSISLLAYVAYTLGDSERAKLLYNLALPYRSQNVLGDGVCLGSTEQFLALLATTMSNFEEAQKHYEAAIAMNAKIDAPPR